MDETLIIREIANGIWFFLNCFLAATFGWFVIKAMQQPNWRHRASVLLSIGLTTYFTGSTLMRLWVWILLLTEGRGDDYAFVSSQWWVPLVAAAITTTGALCTIRVVLPEWVHPMAWIGVGLISVSIPLAAHFLWE
jgi:hypothetical protein